MIPTPPAAVGALPHSGVPAAALALATAPILTPRPSSD